MLSFTTWKVTESGKGWVSVPRKVTAESQICGLAIAILNRFVVGDCGNFTIKSTLVFDPHSARRPFQLQMVKAPGGSVRVSFVHAEGRSCQAHSSACSSSSGVRPRSRTSEAAGSDSARAAFRQARSKFATPRPGSRERGVHAFETTLRSVGFVVFKWLLPSLVRGTSRVEDECQSIAVASMSCGNTLKAHRQFPGSFGLVSRHFMPPSVRPVTA